MPSNTQTTDGGIQEQPPESRTRPDLSAKGTAPDKKSNLITVIDKIGTPRSLPPTLENQAQTTQPAKEKTSLKKLLGIQCEHTHDGDDDRPQGFFRKLRRKVVKYTKFIGPGFMVSVAYIDPGTLVYTKLWDFQSLIV
jgi:hypothetical protein